MSEPSLPSFWHGYKREHAESVLDEYSFTALSLEEICKKNGHVSARMVRQWAANNIDDFGDKFEKARKLHAQTLVDAAEYSINKITSHDTYIDANGNKRLDAARVQLKKLRMDLAHYVAKKELPAKYGDKIEQTHKIDKLEDWLDQIKDIK